MSDHSIEHPDGFDKGDRPETPLDFDFELAENQIFATAAILRVINIERDRRGSDIYAQVPLYAQLEQSDAWSGQKY